MKVRRFAFVISFGDVQKTFISGAKHPFHERWCVCSNILLLALDNKKTREALRLAGFCTSLRSIKPRYGTRAGIE